MNWHQPTEKPVNGATLFILNQDDSIDWLGSQRNADISTCKGWMYFSDVCEILKLAVEMRDGLRSLIKWDKDYPIGEDTGAGLKELDRIIAQASEIINEKTDGTDGTDKEINKRTAGDGNE